MDKWKINGWKWKKGINSCEVLEDRVLRKNIFGSRREEGAGDWRR
jgi:hypothetical protein